MKIKEALELDLWQTYDSIIGLDEAGRGPIAGPLVVAGVIFPKGYTHEELYDSKKISEKKRNQLFEEIKQQALYYEILVISEAHIDTLNIYRATQQAMESIVQNATLASFALSDAMPLPHVDLAYEAVVKGDQKSFSIAAASILAKVTRDRLMLALHKAHPQYGFDKHKGYPTKAHLEALQTHGVLACHRKSYGPVAKQLLAQLQFTL